MKVIILYYSHAIYIPSIMMAFDEWKAVGNSSTPKRHKTPHLTRIISPTIRRSSTRGIIARLYNRPHSPKSIRTILLMCTCICMLTIILYDSISLMLHGINIIIMILNFRISFQTTKAFRIT